MGRLAAALMLLGLVPLAACGCRKPTVRTEPEGTQGSETGLADNAPAEGIPRTRQKEGQRTVTPEVRRKLEEIVKSYPPTRSGPARNLAEQLRQKISGKGEQRSTSNPPDGSDVAKPGEGEGREAV